MNYIIYILLITITAAIIRFAFIQLNRNVFKQGFFGDSSVHWMLVKTIKNNLRFTTIPQYLIGNEPSSYPRAFHFYARLFPLSAIKKMPWLPNFILFILFSGFFFSYSLYFFEFLNPTSVLGAFLAFLFFIFAVSNTTFDGPAIAYLKLSERLLARLLGSVYFLTMAVAIDYNDTTSLFISIIIGSFAGNASKFGRQTILFITPLVALALLNITPILILIGSILGSLILGRKHFIHSVKCQIKHLIVYQTDIKEHVKHKNTLSSFIKLNLIFNRDISFKEWVKNLICNEPIRAMIRYPELLIILLWIAIAPEYSATVAIILSSLLVYLLTSTKWLSHFGEAYRYLEYSLSFLAPLLLAQIFLIYPKVTVLASLSFIIFSLIIAFILNYIFKNKSLPEQDVLSDFIKPLDLKKDDAVFPVSMRLGADICSRAPCKSFWWQPGNTTKSIFNHFIEQYPYLKKDWRKLAHEFNVTHIIVDKKAEENIDWSYDFSELSIILENDNYICYKVETNK